ncbi:hypothetical protein PPN31114_04535 [Pandoraea pneumonica]|uniref:Uncharacterized protein n=1 Tax=Pandoraea pneumonica TaxID=2508299 RepID=A0A5E4YJ89_9BURK|nr:hypothetical protein PPN31114_04535 [Pandoraea pneumonica]
MSGGVRWHAKWHKANAADCATPSQVTSAT